MAEFDQNRCVHLDGFAIQPKEKKASDLYFLVRSNEESPYDDELGKQYHFTENVPNYKKLVVGAHVVVLAGRSCGSRQPWYLQLPKGHARV